MNALKKNLFITSLCVLGITTIIAQNNTQSFEMPPSSNEKVIGTISGELVAGEAYDLYYYQESFIKEFSKWKYVEWKDRRSTFSIYELHEKCLSAAKSKYGDLYPNLYLRSFKYEMSEQDLPDNEYYSNVIGSTDYYKNTNRIRRVYKYSAMVVVAF